jgi:imidazolonepropionase-like amidohydrolase
MTARSLILVSAALAATASLGGRRAAAPDAYADSLVAIRARAMVDVRRGTLVEHPVVVVREGRIVSAGPGSIPAGARVIDLADLTLLPGLIDAHVHLTIRGRPRDNAVDTLRAGFTTVQAIAHGARIVFGTDTGVIAHGTNAVEFEALQRAGVTPQAAIRAATVDAARLLGLADSVGALERGYVADIIAVPGDPLRDTAVLERVSFVMQGGRVIVAVPPAAR